MSQQLVQNIPVNLIDPHPLNPNEMSEAYYDKLKKNIARTGRYPSTIVRKMTNGRYQMLDGWHRLQIVTELGHKSIKAEVWDVDDKEADLYLSTLNRLKGSDDTKKRSVLLRDLYDKFNEDKTILNFLPESERAFESLLKTLEADSHFDEDTERGLMEEKLMQAGVDDETAERMANHYQPPTDKFIMKFVFTDGVAYNMAVKLFGKGKWGDTSKLITLLTNYGEAIKPTNQKKGKKATVRS